MIKRRMFLCGLMLGTLVAPVAAEAQKAGRVPRIGFIGALFPADASPRLDAFRQGLRKLGWVEGQNIVIDYPEGRFDRLPDLATELVRLKVDIIVAVATKGVAAAKNATETIPIVMIAGSADPVGLGFIASLARPGGNVTGLSFSVGPEILGKGLELLKETVPKVRRVAILSNPASPVQPLFIEQANVAAGRWACSFNSWRPEVPTSSTAHSRQWPQSVWEHSSYSQIRCSSSTEHVSQTSQQGAACRQHTELGSLWRPGSHVLRAEHARSLSARRHLRGQNSQGREARGPANRTPDDLRARHQPQDRQDFL